jgi:hypothetical protein
MRYRSLLTIVACAAALGGFGAGSAFAGEITGNGKPVPAPQNAASECSFSGYNDDLNEAAPFGGTIAQSYGLLVAQGYKDAFPSPGDACNPSKSG